MCSVVQTCSGRDLKAAILQHRFCETAMTESVYGNDHCRAPSQAKS